MIHHYCLCSAVQPESKLDDFLYPNESWDDKLRHDFEDTVLDKAGQRCVVHGDQCKGMHLNATHIIDDHELDFEKYHEINGVCWCTEIDVLYRNYHCYFDTKGSLIMAPELLKSNEYERKYENILRKEQVEKLQKYLIERHLKVYIPSRIKVYKTEETKCFLECSICHPQQNLSQTASRKNRKRKYDEVFNSKNAICYLSRRGGWRYVNRITVINNK